MNAVFDQAQSLKNLNHYFLEIEVVMQKFKDFYTRQRIIEIQRETPTSLILGSAILFTTKSL